MNAVTLPFGTVYIKYSTVMHLLTTALCPKTAPDSVVGEYGKVYANIDRKLTRAIELGDLKAKDPLTHQRHPYPVGQALREADILVEDLQHYVAEHGLPMIELSANSIDRL